MLKVVSVVVLLAVLAGVCVMFSDAILADVAKVSDSPVGAIAADVADALDLSQERDALAGEVVGKLK